MTAQIAAVGSSAGNWRLDQCAAHLCSNWSRDTCGISRRGTHSGAAGPARAARQHREGGGGRDQESGQGKAGRRQDRGRRGEGQIEAERSRCSDHLCE